MKITTSLYFSLITLILSIGYQGSLLAQCQPDGNSPTFVTCPSDTTYAIEDSTTCQPSLYWPLPVVDDSCIAVTTGFTGFLAFSNFTQTTTGTGTAVYADFSPDSIRIRGTAGGTEGSNSTADMCVRFSCSGTIEFDWAARKSGFSLSFAGDHAFYLLNGTPVQLTPNTGATASGSVTLVVAANDELCFRVASNNVATQTFLTISAIEFVNIQLVQTLGPTPDSAPGAGDGDPIPAGVHVVEYLATDCAGNTATCSFTITATDTPPSIICPPDVIINLDTFDCNRVYCYNVTAEDNCTNSDLVIPGFQFLGVHNGNTYYISAPGLANHELWVDANLNAAQLGGHLVTIEDTAENSFLTSNIPFTPGLFNNQYWIGLRYFPFIADFKWTTGEPFNYSNWGFGQPGIIDGDFVYFWDLFAGTWFDSPSLFGRRYIVEFEGGLQIQLIQGIPSGNPFPPGLTTNIYEVTDANGQTASCSFDVEVIGSTSLACKSINVSLDENCQILITPQMLLTGLYNCYDVFEISLSLNGNVICNPIDTTCLAIGTTIIAMVTDPTTGNSCWSEVLIEDKLAPFAVCLADTTDCFLFNRDFPLNYDGRDCSPFTVKTIDERIEHFDCDSVFLKAVYRDILITDASGNTDQCTDTILVTRIQAGDIFLPDDQVTLDCRDTFLKDENGNPSPVVTGLPFVILSDGTIFQIWPLNSLLDCHLLIQYEDIDLGEINCVRKIMRSWTVREWFCGTEITRNVLQLILIQDLFGPIITHAPYNFSATTGRRDCEARVLLPGIEAFDICHDSIRVDIVFPGGILINQNGGFVDLPVGEDTIFYRVYDACYNLTEIFIIVSVTDDTEPVAVCDRNTVVSLNHAGFTWVPAEVFDDGSFDECALHHFEVRRMDSDFCGGVGEDDFGPEVVFCCEDVGKIIMVAFKAIDVSGNEGICMVSVYVQDKNRPLITCIPDITVDCRFDIDFNNLDVFGKIVTDSFDRDTIIIDPRFWHIIGGHPQDGLVSDNCPASVLVIIDTTNINQCGLGYIIRTFQGVDAQGNRSDICTQRITIINHDTFDIDDIIWPLDLDTIGICDPNDLIPERLPFPYGRPIVKDDECSLIGYSYHDVIFSPTIPGDPCFKIHRTWKVIDWCQRDLNNNIIIWTHLQIIRVINDVDPTIIRVSPDTIVCSYDILCRPIPVSFSILATDDCTDSTQMLYTYKIDFDGDGTIDFVRAGIGENVASGTFPLGRHIVKWEVEDRCGNTAKVQFVLDLRNCKSPVAYCLNGLSTSLTPMDTTGDGIPDTAMDTVWAKDFDAGSYHNCGYPIVLSFSADTNNTFRVYDCDSIGSRTVELWVTDINGNTSFCRTFIDIQDNSGFCPPNLKNSNVQGITETEGGSGVQNVTIELLNSGLNSVKTDGNGKYSFLQIPNGQSLVVKPSKTDDWLNGVTTSDIVKIQRHILGIETLTSAYKMIAADVNKSNTITTKDISDLRRLILGITSDVPGNTSWRFVHQLYSFNDVMTALNQTIPETYDINSLNSNMGLDFYAIKIGDINGSAATKGFNSSISRNSNVMELQMDELNLDKDNSQEMEIRVVNGSAFEGFQFTLQWDINQLDLESILGNEELKISDNNFSLLRREEGKLSFSWNGKMDDGDWILKLRFKAKQTTKVSEALAINSGITPALSIANNDGGEGQVIMNFRGSSAEEFVVLQNEPNPWNHETNIGMLLPQSGEVTITVYDANGKVYLSDKVQMNKGYNEYILNKEQLGHSGVYYYQVDFMTNTASRKMLIAD